MKERIIGLRSISAQTSAGAPYEIHLELLATQHYNFQHLLDEKWGDLFPGNVIVKCGHCGQWGAVKTACKHCGAPID